MTETEANKVAYVFPGQGTQWVGMGAQLYKSSPLARKVFDEADEALGFSLSKLCFEGPEEELGKTIYAQPAIMTVSIAALRAAGESDNKITSGRPAFVAGHSLGEYTAMVAAGVVDFKVAIKIVWERGRLMHEAGQIAPGCMTAILGLDEAALEGICLETGAQISNLNCPGQVVISGTKEAVAKATELAKARGARRAIPLDVSGAFHSHLMEPAIAEMSRIIAKVNLRDPIFPVIANSTARPLTKAAEIKVELVEQLCHCVRWQQSVEYMVNSGVSTFVEIGPGQVLSGLIKRIDRTARAINIGETKLAGELI